MTAIGWAQIVLVLALVFAAAVPLGLYIASVLQGRQRFLGAVERGFYRLAGVDPAVEMGWRGYASALIVLSALHFLLLYAILRLQQYLPLNPMPGRMPMSPQLAFNTAISFVTNTNWQAYGGETARCRTGRRCGASRSITS